MTALVKLMEEALGDRLEELDEDARFIALGLDSLLLTQLARLVRSRLGFEVTFRQLTEGYSTPRLLATAIRESNGNGAGPAPDVESPPPAPPRATASPSPTPPPAGQGTGEDVPPVPGARLGKDEQGRPAWFLPDPDRPGKYLRVESPAPDRTDALPATPAQREMWRLTETSPDASCAFNDSMTLRLTGSVDHEAMAAAVQTLAERHEALRGRLADGGQLFVIEPKITVPVTRHDLAGRSAAERAGALAELESADAQAPYDLREGPLVRATLARLDDQEHAVILGVHRAACDGWSLDVLLYDLGQVYTALVTGAGLPAPPRHGVSNYHAYRAEPQFAARIESGRRFWREALALASPSQDPVDAPSTARGRSHSTHHAGGRLSSGLVASAKQLSRDQGISFFTVLLSTLAVLLHRGSGVDDVAIGVPVAGQPDAGMEDCVGHLASLVPVRCHFEPGLTFLDLYRAVGGAILDARENAAAGLEEIAEEAVAGNGAGPLVSAVFTHVQEYAPGKLQFGDCAVKYHPNPRRRGVFDLEITAFETHEGLDVMAQALAAGRDRGWLQTVVQEFESVLREGLETPQAAVHGGAGVSDHEPEPPAAPDGDGEVAFEQP
jgi:aryl carrier-like protein